MKIFTLICTFSYVHEYCRGIFRLQYFWFSIILSLHIFWYTFLSIGRVLMASWSLQRAQERLCVSSAQPWPGWRSRKQNTKRACTMSQGEMLILCLLWARSWRQALGQPGEKRMVSQNEMRHSDGRWCEIGTLKGQRSGEWYLLWFCVLDAWLKFY